MAFNITFPLIALRCANFLLILENSGVFEQKHPKGLNDALFILSLLFLTMSVDSFIRCQQGYMKRKNY